MAGTCALSSRLSAINEDDHDDSVVCYDEVSSDGLGGCLLD